MRIEKSDFTPEQQAIFELSEQLVKIQGPIRILDSIKWDKEIQRKFFQSKFKELPQIDQNYYLSKPLPFKPEDKIQELYTLELAIKKRLGQLSGVGHIMQRMCREYRAAVRLIQTRGTTEFSHISQSLYGSSEDVFYVGGPSLTDLANLLVSALPALHKQTQSDADIKKYNAHESVDILRARLGTYFGDINRVFVEVSDDLIADAAAGAEMLRVRSDAMFSERDLKLLEVHEGWVHLGTTFNGLVQPVCTFLSKGPPSSTICQEGLAVIMEIFTFTAFPARLQRLANRVIAINMVEKGANFIEVFHFFLAQGHSEEDSYGLTTRVFRGSLPEGMGPFTKDIVYNKGFVMIYNYIRLAIRHGVLDQIPLLFLGKATLDDLPVYVDMIEHKLIEPPQFLPPQFKDLAALSSWMSYSMFMNNLDMKQFAVDYRTILRL